MRENPENQTTDQALGDNGKEKTPFEHCVPDDVVLTEICTIGVGAFVYQSQ